MKGLSTLALLFSVVLLCSAAPALEPVTCDGDSAIAARLAMHHINNHHDHGYKFRLLQVQGSNIEKTDTGCNMELNLNLMETECHIFNPKHFEDCEFRPQTSVAVTASCTVKMTVVLSDATVSSYTCTTQKDDEIKMTCPDCPALIALNDQEGQQIVDKMVTEFNKDPRNQHYFVQQQVGRIRLGYIPMAGMQYYIEIILRESRCLKGTKIFPTTCGPMCPERAQHAVCKASYSKSGGLSPLECEYYPALITDPPVAEEQYTCINIPPPNSEPLMLPAQVQLGPDGLSPGPHAALHRCHTNPSLEFHRICDWPL